MKKQLNKHEWLGRVQEKFEDRVTVKVCPDNPTGQSRLTACCKQHGLFETCFKHLLKSNTGCPKCAKEAGVSKHRLGYENFLTKANAVHNGRYRYFAEDFETYGNNQTKIRVTCPEHGVFTKSVKRHLMGDGCSQCNKLERSEKTKTEGRRKKVEQLVANHKHLSLIDEAAGSIKVVCNRHGEVQTTLHRLKGKYGCPECTREAVTVGKSGWLTRFTEVHGIKYDYSNVSDETLANTPVQITCKQHKEPFEFYQTPSDHADGHGCPACKLCNQETTTGKGELELKSFLESLGLAVETQKILVSDTGKPMLIDLCIPDKRLLIEFNGLYFHSQRFIRDSSYHLRRQKVAESKGYRLIHIFEDDWHNRHEVVKNILRLMLTDTVALMARKCKPVRVTNEEARAFYNKYHLQEASVSRSQVHYGLEHDDRLVAVMSFSPQGSNRNFVLNNTWELVRFACRYRIQGGASRLFHRFVRELNPPKVVSFSWNHLFTGGMYQKLGFTLDKVSQPDYMYVDPNRCKRLHKSGFQKAKLAKRFEGVDTNLTEREICESLNYYRIYDCGKRRWVWTP